MAMKEVCIAAHDSASGHTKAGDIIVIREPGLGIGLKEGKDFVWLIMDEEDLPTEPLRKVDPTGGKHRYNLPLSELKTRAPEIDLAKVADGSQHYQPFMDTDPTTGMHRKSNLPVRVTGVIADKEAK